MRGMKAWLLVVLLVMVLVTSVWKGLEGMLGAWWTEEAETTVTQNSATAENDPVKSGEPKILTQLQYHRALNRLMKWTFMTPVFITALLVLAFDLRSRYENML